MDLSDIGQVLLLAVFACFTLATYLLLPVGRARSTTHPARRNQESLKDGRTFRVRGVPLSWNAEQVRSFLEGHHCSATTVVKSLATEIHVWRTSQHHFTIAC